MEKARQSGSLAAAVHRRWIDIKSAITGKDETSVLNECERGEDIAVSTYKTALDGQLPSNVNTVVENQFNTVKATHDKIRDLRDAAKAATN